MNQYDNQRNVFLFSVNLNSSYATGCTNPSLSVRQAVVVCVCVCVCVWMIPPCEHVQN
jgi:hypothetical protein